MLPIGSPSEKMLWNYFEESFRNRHFEIIAGHPVISSSAGRCFKKFHLEFCFPPPN
jgi:hypothetical protein